jgi:hypothetical protein
MTITREIRSDKNVGLTSTTYFLRMLLNRWVNQNHDAKYNTDVPSSYRHDILSYSRQ